MVPQIDFTSLYDVSDGCSDCPYYLPCSGCQQKLEGRRSKPHSRIRGVVYHRSYVYLDFCRTWSLVYGCRPIATPQFLARHREDLDWDKKLYERSKVVFSHFVEQYIVLFV